MPLEQLLIFITAVETLNFSEAARRMHQSQPAVSQQIKALETELNVSLFERSYRQLKLPTAGGTLYAYALRIRQELEAAQSAISELQGEVTGPLRWRQYHQRNYPMGYIYRIPEILLTLF